MTTALPQAAPAGEPPAPLAWPKGHWALGLCTVATLQLWAPAAALAQGTDPSIYTCVDSRGRRLTSDRPIAECLDREQRELSPSGATKRVLPPSLSGEERALRDAQLRDEALARARADEERRRDRALLARYPTEHHVEVERTKQLEQVQDVIKSIQQRKLDLDQQLIELKKELEFYGNDPKRAPSWLQRRLKENAEQQQAQQRFMAAQALESQRVNQRFDEELARLRQLWRSAQAR